MSKIKVAELFYSIQGEGRFMGAPSVFLRTFGCNFTCQGFGMPRGELSTEAQFVDPAKYRSYNELPLVSTGCDSYASWDARFKDLSPLMEVDGIVDRIMEIIPFRGWKDEHLVITGGEPLLGWQRAYPDLLTHEKMTGLKQLTFETNGSMRLTKEFRQFLLNWTLNSKYNTTGVARGREALTFSVSAKLPCSGEKWEDAIKPEVVLAYEDIGHTYLKFVVATEQDVQDALKATKEFRDAGFKGNVYLMPVGGVESVYQLNNKAVAIHAMNNGMYYSDRLQVPLFKNEWGT
jgi:7-carboxy-7-deazaguanine synthase